MNNQKQHGMVLTDPAEACRVIMQELSNPAHRRFLICGHMRPDGDCIGSMMAFHHYLRARDREVRLYFQGALSHYLLPYLPDEPIPDPEFPVDYHPDVTLCLDCAAPDRVTANFAEKAEGLIINVDHHHKNPMFGDLNWVSGDYAAVGEMGYHLMQADPQAWTPQIANCLYLGLLTDTGSFRYGNTSPSVLKTAAGLAERGADPHAVADSVYANRKRETVRIAAEVIAHLRYELDGTLVIGEIPQSLLAANGGESNEPDNLSGELRAIEGVRVALLIRESAEGDLRGSLRSDGSVDVSAIAALFDGGGHPAASGLSIDGPYETARNQLIQTVTPAVKKQL